MTGLLGVVLLTSSISLAQQTPPSEAPPAPLPQQGDTKPGLIDSINRWFDRGAASFREQWTGARRRIDDLNDEAAANSRGLNEKATEAGRNAADATRSAIEAVGKFSNARIMAGRERCAIAPNGAPDCIAAAEALCRKHGFASGSSMDFTSAEECPPRTVLGGTQAGGECKTVTFISRAMCQ